MRLSKGNRVTEAFILVVNLEPSEFEKESSLEGELQQNIATDNECNNQSLQPKVDLVLTM